MFEGIIDSDDIEKIMQDLLGEKGGLHEQIDSIDPEKLIFRRDDNVISCSDWMIDIRYDREGDVKGTENSFSLRFNKTRPNIAFYSDHNASLVMPELRCSYIDIFIDRKNKVRLSQQKYLFGAGFTAKEKWIDEGSEYIRKAVEKTGILEEISNYEPKWLRY